MYDKINEVLNSIEGQPLSFGEGGLWALNIILALIMFGVALDIKKMDFVNILKFPKSIITGYLAQFLFLPLVTFLLVYITQLPIQISLGMILVASCPGGNISNFISSLAKGNVALSVSLTALSDLSALIMTPINFTFWAGLYVSTLELAHPISIPFLDVLQTVVILMGIPLLLGMWFADRFPNVTKKIFIPIKYFSIIAFLIFILVAFFSNVDIFYNYIWFIFPVVLIHNALALTLGWSLSSIVGLNKKDKKTITIETGIQNSGMALVLIFNNEIFPEGYSAVAFIVAWWGVWHIISGLAMGWAFSKIKEKKEVRAKFKKI